MNVEHLSAAHSPSDVLERVLDKGIVVHAWVLVSVAGIQLIGVQARVVVASIETYLRHGHQLVPPDLPRPVTMAHERPRRRQPRRRSPRPRRRRR